jgi:hypothetical protein
MDPDEDYALSMDPTDRLRTQFAGGNPVNNTDETGHYLVGNIGGTHKVKSKKGKAVGAPTGHGTAYPPVYDAAAAARRAAEYKAEKAAKRAAQAAADKAAVRAAMKECRESHGTYNVHSGCHHSVKHKVLDYATQAIAVVPYSCYYGAYYAAKISPGNNTRLNMAQHACLAADDQVDKVINRYVKKQDTCGEQVHDSVDPMEWTPKIYLPGCRRDANGVPHTQYSR